MGFLKKTVYDKLVAKVNNIDTNEFVLKTKYDIEVPILKRKSMIQEKIPNISGLVKKKQVIMIKILIQKAKYLPFPV